MRFRLLALCTTVLSLAGCIDTNILIDLRNPNDTLVEVKAGLSEPAIDVLTLQYPELRHGEMTERGKQLRTCEAFFADEPRASEVLRSAQPITREGVTITKVVGWQNGVLTCGFSAIGPSEPVLTMLEGSDLIKVNRVGDRFRIQVNTKHSDYSAVPDLGFFESLGPERETPTLQLSIYGHRMTSNFEIGQLSGSQFELAENLMGKRLHYQHEFTVEVSARQPDLKDRIAGWWDAISLYLQRLIQSLKQHTAADA